MLNEILNKREDREVWRIKEQIEIGKLKRVMHDRLPCVRLSLSLYFRNRDREQCVAKTTASRRGKSRPQPAWGNCSKQKGKWQAQICSYPLIAQFTLDERAKMKLQK